MIEASQQPPDPTRCQCDDDVGRLYHDEALDIWYECFWDSRRGVYTWAILPPDDDVSDGAS
jgi:hypothetical protein